MNNLDLTPFEKHILERSSNTEITRRRRMLCIVSGISVTVALIAMALIMRSWKFVLSVAVLHMTITIWEKVAYSNAVLAYKSLIQKMKARIEELEPE